MDTVPTSEKLEPPSIENCSVPFVTAFAVIAIALKAVSSEAVPGETLSASSEIALPISVAMVVPELVNASSSRFTSGYRAALIVGASFTEFTVIVKAFVLSRLFTLPDPTLEPLSRTFTLIDAVPFALALGV